MPDRVRDMSNEQRWGVVSALPKIAAMVTDQRILGLTGLAICCGLLIVGLWPFNFFPKNRVEWLRDRNGIRFKWNGMAYSQKVADLSSLSRTPKIPEVTIEIWLQPGRQGVEREGEFFSIYNPAQRFNLGLRQRGSSLAVYGWFCRGSSAATPERLILSNFFREGEATILTITTGDAGTTFYLNGIPAMEYPDLSLAARSLIGRVVVGHSPVGHEPWDGNVLGVCICGAAFDQQLVHAWYVQSTDADGLVPYDSASLLAFYPFSEGGVK